MAVIAGQPFNAFIAGRQARQQEDYANTRNSLAQAELANMPEENQRRNALLDSQIAASQQAVSQNASIFAKGNEQDDRTWGYNVAVRLTQARDPNEFGAIADAIAADPRALRLGIRRDMLTPERAQQIVGQAAVGAGAAPAPPQLETIYGPSDTILQRDPATNKLTQVVGRAPQTNVNVNSQGPLAETAAQRAFGELEGKAFGDLLSAGQAAQEKLSQLRAMQDNPAITGPTQDFRAAATAFFSDLGVPVAPERLAQVSNLAQYKSMQGRLVFDELGKQKGPQTEGDAKRAMETYGNTKNIQEANRLVLNYQAALTERQAELAQLAEDYRLRTGKIDGWRQVVNDYVRSTPLNGKNKETGRLVFINEFKQAMRENNPGMSDEEILGYWRKNYGGR